MALVYKMLENGEGIAIDENGRPLVYDDEKEEEKEFGLDGISLYSKIPALNAEAKKYREEKQKILQKYEPLGDLDPAEIVEKLNAFGDIDPNEARKAINTVANLDALDKDKDAELEKVRQQVAEGYKEKIKQIDAANNQKLLAREEVIQQKDNIIRNMMIRGAFDRSKYIAEQTVLPSDIAYSKFGKFFQVEEDGEGGVQVYAIDASGEKIVSKANPGETAPPEEAIELIINEYPRKDDILRSSGGGSGAGGNRETTSTKLQERKRLEGMSAAERLAEIRKKR